MNLHQRLFKAHSKFINHVPFIKLGEVSNLSELVHEANSIYQERDPLTMLSKHPTDLGYTGVDVMGIYDYSGLDIAHYGESYLGSHNIEGVEFTLGEQTQLTELGKQMPVAKSAFDSLLDWPGRCRISRLPPHKHGGWHSHGKMSLMEITLHIPLISNQMVQAQVGACPGLLNNEDAYKYYEPENFHSTVFAPGEIWLLNGMHSHRVINDSDHARVHLWSQSFFMSPDKQVVNQKLLELLENALETYTGPYINLIDNNANNKKV